MLNDTERLDWVIDILSLGDDTKTDAKTVKLFGAIALGKQGRAAIDLAMGDAPATDAAKEE